MKNTMTDVRNHLCAMMEALNDEDCGRETIAKSNALTNLANSYVSSVKAEIDALRVASETGLVSRCIEAPKITNTLSLKE